MSVATVEKLIATVARAFYSDNFVIMLDTLVREKYIREEEIAPRLKMMTKDVRKVIQQLESEMMIRSESMTMEDGRVSNCYYIDYQLFVHVVRYRVHLMKKALSSNEKSLLNDIYYQCPTCKDIYSSLQAQKLYNKDFKFICSSCCPHDDFRNAPSAISYTLIEVDKNMDNIHNLLKKLEDQLYQSLDHDGIFNLLAELKDVPITRNLPSENRKYGIKATTIIDEEIIQEVTEKIGTKQVSKKAMSKVNTSQFIMGKEVEGNAFEVRIEDTSSSIEPPNKLYKSSILSTTSGITSHPITTTTTAATSSSSSTLSSIVKDIPTLPDFLTSSRVISAEQLQNQRLLAAQQQFQQGGILSSSNGSNVSSNNLSSVNSSNIPTTTTTILPNIDTIISGTTTTTTTLPTTTTTTTTTTMNILSSIPHESTISNMDMMTSSTNIIPLSSSNSSSNSSSSSSMHVEELQHLQTVTNTVTTIVQENEQVNTGNESMSVDVMNTSTSNVTNVAAIAVDDTIDDIDWVDDEED